MPSFPDVTEIILVEDNPDDAELTIRALKKHNLTDKLAWVKDGAAALDFVFARGAYSDRDIDCIPKLILLDLRLPRLDGFEVMKILRSDERTKLIPVVVISASREDRDISECYKLGVNGYISKSLDSDVFTKGITDSVTFWLSK